ncbi:MAG: RpoL/Rpb11 RNA polymerase subunit family protein [archaeon]|nr:RpoL/Rpb11 RNA polymerase subunit family protein [archaeon]
MEVEVIKSDKNEIEIKTDNVTVVEVLRVYLYENGAEFAAWKREHPSKPAILKIKSSGKTATKAISDAIAAIKKDCNSLLVAVKK